MLVIVISVKAARNVKAKQALFVEFPFDMALVAKIKSLPRREFFSDNREWEVPIRDVNELLSVFQEEPITFKAKVWTKLDPNEKKVLEKVSKLVRFDAPDLTHFAYKTTPFQHQVEAVSYAQKNTKFLLGDEQGLGKTKESIDIAVGRRGQFKHTLIVCGVNSVRINWYMEVAMHSNEKARILGGSFDATGRFREADKPNEARLADLNSNLSEYFLIVNVQALRNDDVADKLAAMCADGTIGYVIVDEIHKVKNPTAQQAKGLLKLDSFYKSGLSGTLLVNNPLDLFVPLKWIGAERHSFTSYKSRYCIFGGFGGYEIVGYQNLDELTNLLHTNMLRRTKEQVLDLPPKLRSDEYLELGAEQSKLYRSVQKALRDEYLDKVYMTSNPLAIMLRLRQATGTPELLSTTVSESVKLDRLEEMVEAVAESGGKALVFTNWEEAADLIRKRLERFNPAYYTGKLSTGKREEEFHKFQGNKHSGIEDDPTCKVMVGTIGAMGTGLTLTKAQTVIFFDRPWTKTDVEQAEDRTHRIGTTGTVNVVTLRVRDSVDDRVEEIIEIKSKLSKAIVDNDPKLIAQLNTKMRDVVRDALLY